jgi:glycosyltransferase 2 family protein
MGIMRNMSRLIRVSRYVPLIVGLLILLVIALLAPWGQIEELLERVPPSIFLALAGLSVLYYVSKTIRFWYILRLLDIHAPLRTVSLLYLSGQPFSLLPAGELYRTILLKKHLGIHISKSSPSVTIQGLVEAIVLLSLSVVGAFVIGRNRIAVGIICVLLVTLITALQRGWLIKAYSFIIKLPYVSIDESKFQKFIKSHQELLAPRSLIILVAFSLIPVFSGISILYLASRAVGFDIGYVHSMIAYSLPVIISGLSFIPGGLGVSEGGTIGMVQLFGASAAAAVTIALLVRIFTLISGLIYGVIAQLILHLRKKLA